MGESVPAPLRAGREDIWHLAPDGVGLVLVVPWRRDSPINEYRGEESIDGGVAVGYRLPRHAGILGVVGEQFGDRALLQNFWLM
jgi:hypothetical protein